MIVSLLGAVLALALLTLLPGPDVAIVTRIVLTHGRAAACKAACGIAAGLLTWGLLTVAGLSALLAASAEAYMVVKLAGAAYLLWLGIQTIWHSQRHSSNDPVFTLPRARRPWLTGFTNNLLNPKIAVFYTSLLPQLVPSGAPHAITLFGLVIAHAILTVSWLTVYSFAVDRTSGVLRRPRVRKALDRLTGATLIGFGIRVATSEHN
jgi:threonine/homoserine/homoserine lactone efflux protein